MSNYCSLRCVLISSTEQEGLTKSKFVVLGKSVALSDWAFDQLEQKSPNEYNVRNVGSKHWQDELPRSRRRRTSVSLNGNLLHTSPSNVNLNDGRRLLKMWKNSWDFLRWKKAKKCPQLYSNWLSSIFDSVVNENVSYDRTWRRPNRYAISWPKHHSIETEFLIKRKEMTIGGCM